jgi:hypothetical protein
VAAGGEAVLAHRGNIQVGPVEVEAVAAPEIALESGEQRAGELHHLVARAAHQVRVVRPVGHAVAVLVVVVALAEAQLADQPVVPQDGQCTVHSGQAEARVSPAGQLVDLVGIQVGVRLAQDVQHALPLPGPAVAGAGQGVPRLAG